MHTYAGPDPLSAVMGSNIFSVTSSQIPMECSSFFVMAASSVVAFDPHTKTDAPLLTRAGVLGITLITLDSEGRNYQSFSF